MTEAVDARRHSGTFLDGDPDALADALRAAGLRAARGGLEAAPLAAASPLLDERFHARAGNLASSGALASPAEVVPSSVDGLAYLRQARALFPGDRPSIAGLRGYVAGLALAEGLRDGSDPARIAARLRRPPPFTDALVAPWRADAPANGGPYFVLLSARILTPALVPAGGGHGRAGGYFEGGTWTRASDAVYGPGR